LDLDLVLDLEFVFGFGFGFGFGIEFGFGFFLIYKSYPTLENIFKSNQLIISSGVVISFKKGGKSVNISL